MRAVGGYEMISKRGFMAGAVATAGMAMTARLHAAASPLPVLPAGPEVKPISPEEHAARIAKLQGLMRAAGVGAMIVESGSTLRYFTGIQWWRSERVTAVVIPAEGTRWW